MRRLVIRKGILRSFIHAANLVKLLLASFERSCLSALIACDTQYSHPFFCPTARAISCLNFALKLPLSSALSNSIQAFRAAGEFASAFARFGTDLILFLRTVRNSFDIPVA